MGLLAGYHPPSRIDWVWEMGSVVILKDRNKEKRLSALIVTTSYKVRSEECCWKAGYPAINELAELQLSNSIILAYTVPPAGHVGIVRAGLQVCPPGKRFKSISFQ